MSRATMQGTRVGNWELREKIGEGGMGTVYLAHHLSLDHRAAIKVSSERLADDPGFRQRFLQEARTQARLAHPHVVQVFDHLEQDGRWFLITEYLDHGGLDRFLAERQEPVVVDQALDWALEALDALDFAHSRGVIHRDVKPPNLLLDSGRRIKVTDFGIAVVVGERRMTQTGVTLGTPHYMSPEQIRHPQSVDHRTDVYSFGLVLYELLSGQLPFDAESDYEIQHAQIHQPPLPLRGRNPEVSAALERVIFTALAKRPDDRHVSCAAFARALEDSRPATGSASVPVAEPPPLKPPAAPPDRELERAVERLEARSTKLRHALWATAAALVLALIVTATGFSRASQESRRADALGAEVDSLRSGETEREDLRSRLGQAESLMAARSWPIVLADGFADNDAGWSVGSTVARSIAERYVWRNDGSDQLRFAKAPAEATSDLYAGVEVTPRGCLECSYVLAVRCNPEGKAYLLKVKGSQARIEIAGDRVLEEWTTIESLKPQLTSRLEVTAEGSQLRFYLNGRLWTTLTDTTLDAGTVWLGASVVGDGAWIYFDDFEVRRKPS